MDPSKCTIETKQRAGGPLKVWRCSECRRDATRNYHARLQRRQERGLALPPAFKRALPPEQRKPSPPVGQAPRGDVCLRGHPRTPENTRVDRHGWRRCKICARDRVREAKQAGAPSAVNERPTHCRNGHAYTPENVILTPEGWRRCLICRRQTRADHYQRQKQSPPVTGTPAPAPGQTV